MKNTEKILELKRLRSIILADAQYLGIYKPGDWTSFNRFMLHKSVKRKDLNLYKIEEFPALIKQFKSMRRKYDESKQKIGSRAWWRSIGVE